MEISKLEKVIKGLNNIGREIVNTIGHGEAVPYLRTIDDALAMLKEQDEVISNYKEVVENLLQQLQDINKYMTPIGMVSDVRAYIEGREQPEIIRCYACKHGEKANDVYLCGKPRGFGLAHEPNWFCADAERR